MQGGDGGVCTLYKYGTYTKTVPKVNRYDTGTQRSPTSTLYRSLRLHAPALWLLRRPGLSRWRTGFEGQDARLRTLNTRTREPYRVYSTQLVLDPGPSCSDSCCGRRDLHHTCSVPTSHPHLTPACAIPARRILTSRRLAPSRHVNPQLVEGQRAAGLPEAAL